MILTAIDRRQDSKSLLRGHASLHDSAQMCNSHVPETVTRHRWWGVVLIFPARFWQKRAALPPQPLKPRRIGRRISDGVLNIPVPQIILNEPGIRALIRQ